MTDEARALAIVAALLSGASGSAGFVGGRISAPVPPAEVRYVHVPIPTVPVVPIEEAAPLAPVTGPLVEVNPPVPTPRPEVETAPKAKPPALAKPRPPAPKKSLPSCAVVQRENARMSWAQKMAAYHSATPEQIAHGKRCLGM